LEGLVLVLYHDVVLNVENEESAALGKDILVLV